MMRGSVHPVRCLAAVFVVALGGCGSPEAPGASSYRVYATNEGSGDLSVVDPVARRVEATISLGKRPRGLAASPDGRFVYVALSGSPVGGPGVDEAKLPPPDKTADGIAVVDVAQWRLVRVHRGISDPEQIALSPDGRRLYAASEDTGSLVAIDAQSGAPIGRVAVGGEPEGVAVSPDGGTVYVTSEEDDSVVAVDARQLTVRARIAVGNRPRGVIFARGDRAYVSNEFGGSVSAIDARGNAVAGTTPIAGRDARPMGLALSPDGRQLYVTTGRGGTVVRLDAATLRETGRSTLGPRPWGLAISPDGRTLFTADGPPNTVSVIDARTMAVLARVPAGARPWGVAVVAR